MEHKPNFTPRAQRAIEIAKKCCKELGHSKVSLEHLFLGILNLKAGIVHEVLISVGLDPTSLIESVARKWKRTTTKDIKDITFDKKFKQILEIATLISHNFGHDYVGIEHLLLAMLKYEISDIRDFYKSNLDFLKQF